MWRIALAALTLLNLAGLAMMLFPPGGSVAQLDQELRLRRAMRHLVSERVLVTALESRLEELTSLLDAGRAMNAVLELSEVLRRILDNALDLLEAGDGSVLLVEEPGVLRAV